MTTSDIEIRGAREHNLRDVHLVLPRNELICLTGVSGSGKSSLAFDTLYAEGQRRYVESLSSFARQYLGQMQKPDVDHISGLSPSISISQKTSGQNPRSTVGTITEIYDFLRVLYARIGKGYCPQCGGALSGQAREQIIERALALPAGSRLTILAPVVRAQKGEHRDLFDDLLKQGFIRARVDGVVVRLTDPLSLDRQMRHNIEVVVDRLVIAPEIRPRLAEAVETALRLGQGDLMFWQDDAAEGSRGRNEPSVSAAQAARAAAAEAEPGGAAAAIAGKAPQYLSSRYACVPCGIAFEPPGPQLFSFNSPRGMCLSCQGLGEVHTFAVDKIFPDPEKSFEEGAFAPYGPWDEMGKYKRHVFVGVAETLERVHKLPAGSLLKTPWNKLPPEMQELWLRGTGDLNITFTWQIAGKTEKYGGKFAGLVAALLNTYRESNSRPQRQQLEQMMSVQVCPDCRGERLNPQARAVKLRTQVPKFEPKADLSLPEVCDLAIADAHRFFETLDLSETETAIASEALKEIRGRLGFLLNVGLDYLTLGRTAPTLSGGESQRIRLAGQVGCGLVGVTYILDEPSIGLHPRDNDRLLHTLHQLRDQGNTVVVVEHDEDTMLAADQVIDFGPGPGVRGGHVVAQGSVRDVMKAADSVTGQYLSGVRQIPVPKERRPRGERRLRIVGATHHNLRNVTAEIPLGLFVCVTGVSGSGKSSLVLDVLGQTLHRDLNGGEAQPGVHERMEGVEHLDKLIDIDQSPIGRTPRSNPATYIKVFDDIRDLFAQLSESKTRGYAAGRFSFNKPGGRCEACEGNGANKLEMDFLADVWVACPVCEGKRFNRETLQVKFKGKSISDVLEMDVPQALELFADIPGVAHKLKTLHDVGLDYVKLGQPSPTLSGGEAQRIKLARELVKRSTGKTLYLLDEPTTGLHFADVHRLIEVLQSFVNAGNTVLVIEHNLDVVKTADWVVDVGPEGGAGGGRIVAEGTPEDVAKVAESHTGRALAKLFARHAEGPGLVPTGKPKPKAKRPPPATSIVVTGACQHNLKHVDVEIPRDAMTVCCGLSGSGKSSLAMDTIYAEGQRRYIESLSAYARQFLGQMQKPKVEHVSGLSPAIAIEQKNLGHTPRSTVGTVTEIYDYLRVFFARLGEPYCPECEIPIGTQTSDQIVDQVSLLPQGTKLYLLAPLQVEAGEKYDVLWDELKKQGYLRVRVDGTTHSLEQAPKIDRRRKHTVEVVMDRVVVKPEGKRRLAEGVEAGLSMGRGVVSIAFVDDDTPEPKWKTQTFSQHLACHQCGTSFTPLAPHHFSFNSALGWCPTCEGLGTQLGTNPAALLRDGKATLRQGAVSLWPELSAELTRHVVEALSKRLDVPLDVPFDQLTPKQKRIVYYGSGETWIEVPRPESASPPTKGSSTGGKASAPVLKSVAAKTKPAKSGDAEAKTPPGDAKALVAKGAAGEAKTLTTKNAADGKTGSAGGPVWFRFQFRGLYSAIDEACRTSPAYRVQFDDLLDDVECTACGGGRLRADAGAVRFRGKTVDQLCRMPLADALDFFRRLALTDRERKIAGELIHEISNRLEFLVNVGLDYLTLHRTAPTLSGGETQRIRLASQIGSGLTGVLYVLDEPTIGLHARDNVRLIDALRRLRDLGNTLLLVEHDREVIAQADHLLDFGPKAGVHGGRIVAQGKPSSVAKSKESVTGPYLSGDKAIAIPTNRRMSSRLDDVLGAATAALQSASAAAPELKSAAKKKKGADAGTVNVKAGPAKGMPSKPPVAKLETISPQTLLSGLAGLPNPLPPAPPPLVQTHTAMGRPRESWELQEFASRQPDGAWLKVVGARHNNLRDVTVAFPVGAFTAVTGVSGGGKSSLVEDVLHPALARQLHRARAVPGAHEAIVGIDQINKVIKVDQQPLGNSPTSTPATYTGVFDLVRELFAQLPDAKVRGYTARRFSFNAAGGRCEACEGSGQKLVEMHFLPDVWVECDVCRGKRYNPETLAVLFQGKSINDVLEMSCRESADLFKNIPKIRRVLELLCDVGLDYLKLGQSAPTLSGGEAQRVKLAAELARPDTGRTLYLLDEPTTGLHFEDLSKLLDVLNRLVDLGNTVVVIEHNLDVLKTADWIVELGPEAGERGGRLVTCGTPEDLAAYAQAWLTEYGPPTAPEKKGEAKKLAAPSTPAPLAAQLNADGTPAALRCHTGEALLPVLAAGPWAPRKTAGDHPPEEARPEDLEIEDVGREAKMPWEIDGRKWHTVDRVSRTGEPCKWDPRILTSIVERIEAAEGAPFSETDWNDRSTVEVLAKKRTFGWFFHALTNHPWLATLKFRVARNTFKSDKLTAALALKPLNDLHDLPIYGNEPRVRVKNDDRVFQEVVLRVHGWDEIDRPEFWEFVDQAIASFRRVSAPEKTSPEDLMPWKVLGEKWHLSRKGFPTGRTPQWPVELLAQAAETLSTVAGGGKFNWKNQLLAHFTPDGFDAPWATMNTKKPEALELYLIGPKGRFAMGRVRSLGVEPEVSADRPDRDVVKLKFPGLPQWTDPAVRQFLVEHFQAASNGRGPAK